MIPCQHASAIVFLQDPTVETSQLNPWPALRLVNFTAPRSLTFWLTVHCLDVSLLHPPPSDLLSSSESCRNHNFKVMFLEIPAISKAVCFFFFSQIIPNLFIQKVPPFAPLVGPGRCSANRAPNALRRIAWSKTPPRAPEPIICPPPWMARALFWRSRNGGTLASHWWTWGFTWIHWFVGSWNWLNSTCHLDFFRSAQFPRSSDNSSSKPFPRSESAEEEKLESNLSPLSPPFTRTPTPARGRDEKENRVPLSARCGSPRTWATPATQPTPKKAATPGPGWTPGPASVATGCEDRRQRDLRLASKLDMVRAGLSGESCYSYSCRCFFYGLVCGKKVMEREDSKLQLEDSIYWLSELCHLSQFEVMNWGKSPRKPKSRELGPLWCYEEALQYILQSSSWDGQRVYLRFVDQKSTRLQGYSGFR